MDTGLETVRYQLRFARAERDFKRSQLRVIEHALENLAHWLEHASDAGTNKRRRTQREHLTSQSIELIYKLEVIERQISNLERDLYDAGAPYSELSLQWQQKVLRDQRGHK